MRQGKGKGREGIGERCGKQGNEKGVDQRRRVSLSKGHDPKDGGASEWRGVDNIDKESDIDI